MGTKKGQVRKTARRAYQPKRKQGKYSKSLKVRSRRKRGRKTNLFEFFFGGMK